MHYHILLTYTDILKGTVLQSQSSATEVAGDLFKNGKNNQKKQKKRLQNSIKT